MLGGANVFDDVRKEQAALKKEGDAVPTTPSVAFIPTASPAPTNPLLSPQPFSGPAFAAAVPTVPAPAAEPKFPVSAAAMTQLRDTFDTKGTSEKDFHKG